MDGHTPTEIISLDENNSIELYKNTTIKHGREIFDIILVSNNKRILIPYDPVFVEDDFRNVGTYDGCTGYVTKKNNHLISHDADSTIIQLFTGALSRLLENTENTSKGLITSLQQPSNPLAQNLSITPSIENTSEVITHAEEENQSLYIKILDHIDTMKILGTQYAENRHKISQYNSDLHKYNNTIQLWNNKIQAQKKLQDNELALFEENKKKYIASTHAIGQLYEEYDSLSSDLEKLQQTEGSQHSINIIKKQMEHIHQCIVDAKHRCESLKKSLLLSPKLHNLICKKTQHATTIKKMKKKIRTTTQHKDYKTQQFNKYNDLRSFLQNYYPLIHTIKKIEQGNTASSYIKKLKKAQKQGLIDVSNIIKHYPHKQNNSDALSPQFLEAINHSLNDLEHVRNTYENMTGFDKMNARYLHIRRLKKRLSNIKEEITHTKQYISSKLSPIETILKKLTNTYNKHNTSIPGTEYTWKNIGKTQLTTIPQSFHNIDDLLRKRREIFRELYDFFHKLDSLSKEKAGYEKQINERTLYFHNLADRHKNRIYEINQTLTDLQNQIKSERKCIYNINQRIEKEIRNTSLGDMASHNITEELYNSAQTNYDHIHIQLNKVQDTDAAIKQSLTEGYNTKDYIEKSQHILDLVAKVISYHENNATKGVHIVHDFDRIREVLFSLDDNLGLLSESLSTMPHNNIFIDFHKKDIKKMKKKILQTIHLLS